MVLLFTSFNRFDNYSRNFTFKLVPSLILCMHLLFLGLVPVGIRVTRVLEGFSWLKKTIDYSIPEQPYQDLVSFSLNVFGVNSRLNPKY